MGKDDGASCLSVDGEVLGFLAEEPDEEIGCLLHIVVEFSAIKCHVVEHTQRHLTRQLFFVASLLLFLDILHFLDEEITHEVICLLKHVSGFILLPYHLVEPDEHLAHGCCHIDAPGHAFPP